MPDHSLGDPPYPPKTTHSNTRIESTPSGALPPGGARDCVHICQQFRVRQDILCNIRTTPTLWSGPYAHPPAFAWLTLGGWRSTPAFPYSRAPVKVHERTYSRFTPSFLA